LTIERSAEMHGQCAIAEANLSPVPRVAYSQDKAAFATYYAGPETATIPVDPSFAVKAADVVDISKEMDKDGLLHWDVPPGKWKILRMGYSLTGRENHPATAEATGLEVDKLNRAHVEKYFTTYTRMISGATGSFYAKSFRYFLMDSWEAGEANWTESMLAEFRQRRGYEARPYLPALTGRIIESSEASDQFLWDFRLTIAELLAENHYRCADDFLARQHMGLYAEAMGVALPTTGDGLLNKGQVTIPMGEFWTPAPGTADTRQRMYWKLCPRRASTASPSSRPSRLPRFPPPLHGRKRRSI
jgi:hypothetical protein